MHLMSGRRALALGLLALAGCSSTGTPPPADQSQVDAMLMRGYLSETRRHVNELRGELPHGAEWQNLQWTVPDQGQALPVVVYLPGLGGSTAEGWMWRHAWAAAGYAVVALDPEAGDRDPAAMVNPGAQAAASAAGGSPGEIRARLADQHDALHDQARRRYLPEVAASRLDRLVRLLSALREHPAGSAGLAQRLDLRKVALAGYDVGAYTAMLAAGEVPRSDWAAQTMPIPLAAVVALSPYADFSGSGFAQRYRGIQVPVLSVSGSADEDVAGVVGSAFVRRAPYEHLATGAALLWLKAADHLLLAGYSAGSNPLPAAGKPQGPVGTGHGSAVALSATETAIEMALVASTTTAFLDAQLKGDPLAAQWLARDAARWIGFRGEWRQH
jgi:hypothetical protein